MKERTIKLEDLKNKVAHRNSAVSDEEMEKVAGGFYENRGGYANATEVWCPRCGYDRMMDGETDYNQACDWFWCPRCQAWFADDGRNVWY